ncbi:glycosyltransferase family 2 protein [Tenacibaculum sp. MEBiC06402]|uniref:glycosyltransferase family 2 protein n=1 Tax=unclassified Tenacibaculum TaxID=2635139 RepID=UPI003B9CBE77
MNKQLLASVITVSFNSEKTIEATIKSVLNQNTTDFEYIIIDGNSTDTTVEIIKSYQEKFGEKGIIYKWISEPDKGIYDAFNKGVEKAKGQWISFLGSDDMYLENALNHYFEALNTVSETTDFVHSNVSLANRKLFSGKWKWSEFKRRMTIPHVGAFHNKNYFEKYGLFDTSYKIAGDYEVLLRAKEKLETYWMDKTTVLMSDGGVSNLQIKNTYLETTRAKIASGGVSVFIAKFDYYTWMFKGWVKKMIYAIIG